MFQRRIKCVRKVSVFGFALCRHTPAALSGEPNHCSASFVTGLQGQERGGAIVGDGPFEPYSSDEVEHVSSSSSSSSSLLGRLLPVLVLAGGRGSLGLVVSAVAQPRGLSLGIGGQKLGLGLVVVLLLLLQLLQLLQLQLLLLLLLLLEQVLFLLQLAELLLMLVLLLVLILLMLWLLGLLKLGLLKLKVLL